MISAIAARKAAQAGQRQQQHQGTITTSTNSSSSPPPPPATPPRSQKRRPPSQHAIPPSKKQKKGMREQRSASPRADEFVAQAEVILIESDEEEPASQSLSAGSDVEVLPFSQTITRAWSPSVPLRDSSSGEDVEIDTSELITIPARFSHPMNMNTGGPLSTFVPVPGQNTFHLSAEDVFKLGVRVEARGTIIVLNPGEKLCVLGTCRLTLLRGTISVNGAMLSSSRCSHNIFAPRSSPLPIIEGYSDSSTPAIDTSCLPPSLQSHAQTVSAIVLLQELRSNVESLGRVCRTFEDVHRPSGWEGATVSSPFRLDGLYLVSHQTRDVCPFVLLDSWSSALAMKLAHPVFLVKGPKKCGKSTFSKTLLNTLLTRYQRVAFLECDLGQSEFTPGGMVALNIISSPVFGPPFTHPSIPIRAHYIGATSPRSSPSHYLDAIQNLIQTYRLDLQNSLVDEPGDDTRILDTTPLVVNTMGWAKGLGADLTQKIEEMVEPGRIFEFQSDDHAPSSGNAHILEPAPLSSLSTNFTAADRRTISILSYFHSVFSHSGPRELGGTTAQVWDVTLPLCAMLPYEVDVRVAVDRVVLTGAGFEDVVPSEVARVLNGAVVGLVQRDYHYDRSETTDSELPYIQNDPIPSPSDSSCIGLALIRALEPPFLHLLTPVPPERLSCTKIIVVKGEMELPVWGMLDFRSLDGTEVAGVERGRVPYLQWGRVSESAIGAERRRVRRNLMRRGQA